MTFNPTLVRLRPDEPNGYVEPSCNFQSHAGSIEALICVEDVSRLVETFNPTLVRLRLLLPSVDEVHKRLLSIPRWFD